MAITIYRGDTTPEGHRQLYIAGKDVAGAIIPVSAGWTCTASVYDVKRNLVTTRAITEVQTFDGLAHFLAEFTQAESELMVTTEFNRYSTTYFWSVEISNAVLGYSHTEEIELNVIAKPE